MISDVVRTCFPRAVAAVACRVDEINKLNVFPVPDGDTGTNLNLTLETVVKEIEALPKNASIEDVARAIIHGSLMGARGNSGVITSQILRGIAEGLVGNSRRDVFTSSEIAAVLRNSVKVAFKAVRKPVEGTILTVLRDVSRCADACSRGKLSIPDTLRALVVEAYESVARTPDLLPVLKENGVVDSGAYGFATFLEGFVNAYLGNEGTIPDFMTTFDSTSAEGAAKDALQARVAIENNNDWEGSRYRYCTEFLFHADGGGIDEAAVLAFLGTKGDCELLVGAHPNYKVHVHTNQPDQVLRYMLRHGQIFEVFIHNMDLEIAERTANIAADQDKRDQKKEESHDGSVAARTKDFGVVAVAPGVGMAEILRSLGVDVVIKGGQTMNPSTADILNALREVDARRIIVLPNSANVRMAAEAAAVACDFSEVVVVPTKTVPQAFAAMFAVNETASLAENVEEMSAAITEVRSGEVTTAVRDSHAADGTPIRTGDVMGIVDGSIEVVGNDVQQVTLDVVARMQRAEPGDTLTLLAGSDLDDQSFTALQKAISELEPDLEIDAHRGDQPLYPVVFSIE